MMNNESLEQQLTAFGRAARYPATPDLTASFWQRLEASKRERATPRFALAGLALAVVVATIALTFALAAPARDAAADLFHRINIFQTSQSTEGLPTDIQGRPVTLEQAQTALGAKIAQPSYPANEEIDHVLLQTLGSTVSAAVFYTGDEDFVLFASSAGAGKGIPIGQSIDVEQVDGFGGEAFWVQGRRIVVSLGAGGAIIYGTERVTETNALVWERDRSVYRIEGNLTKDEAIRIAQSVR
jgi:hypothetical protein